MKSSTWRGLLCKLALLGWAGIGGASAQALLIPAGTQFQVNTYVTGQQFDPAVGMQPGGSFVVVWAGVGSAGGDSSGDSVHAQLHDPNGARVGIELQVNDYTTTGQNAPSVASSPGGDFLVVWESYSTPGTVELRSNIHARRFTSSGAPLGTDFRVNALTGGYQHRPAAAVGADGRFVVAWQSNRTSGIDLSSYSVQAQRYDSNGNTAGAQMQVNDYTGGLQHAPAVSFLANGSFVVVWESDGSQGTDTSYTSIQGRRFDSGGNALASEFQVNTYTTDRQHRPAVAAAPDGSFVVAWESHGSAGSDGAGYSIQAQRFDASGGALGSQFQVNAQTSAHQRHPSVRIGPAGDFLVAWTSDDASASGICGHLFASDGSALGGELQVNAFVTGEQSRPAVAAGSAGRFVVVWHSDGSPETDDLEQSIQARLFLRATAAPSATATPTPTLQAGTPSPTPSGSPGPSQTPTRTAAPGETGTATPTGSPVALGRPSGKAGSALWLVLLVGSSLVLIGSRRRTEVLRCNGRNKVRPAWPKGGYA
jgi:hypothetical protein